jgi:hypothetical protein
MLVTLVSAGLTVADTVPADGDIVTTGIQGDVPLGTFAPGEVRAVQVSFSLVCSGFNHVDPNQRVDLLPGSVLIPPGSTISVGGATIQPPGDGWPVDGDDCTSDPDPVPATGTAEVVLTAPPTDGNDQVFVVNWVRRLSPVGFLDSGALQSLTTVTFRMDVVSNTPPVLQLPDDQVVEGNTTGGWIGWTVSATDAEDAVAPTPTCSHSPADPLPIGTTTVACTVEDTGGMTDEGSFTVTVEDTTPPVLAGVPAGLELATSDPDGATLAYDLPTASDLVDASPDVACALPPGEVAPVGDSTVTCTATDDEGNVADAEFPVHVTLWTANWDEPVTNGSPLTANVGRAVPLKVRIMRDGTEVRSGAVGLAVTRCDGGPVLASAPLSWSDGNVRWNGKLDTTGLDNGCHAATLSVDGLQLDGFQLWMTGGPSSAKNPAGGRR